MRELFFWIKFVVVMLLMICAGTLFLSAILTVYQYTPVTPDSGTILATNPNRYGHCTVGYLRPDGAADHADMWIEDCARVRPGMVCQFTLSRSRIMYNVQCTSKESQ